MSVPSVDGEAIEEEVRITLAKAATDAESVRKAIRLVVGVACKAGIA